MTDLFDFKSNSDDAPPKNDEPRKSNVPEFSVGELAFSLKRTLEENYGRIRVRGELSRISIAGSGHMYSTLKDDQAVIDAVCWKGTLGGLSVRPEEGLEVICTGRISSYPKSSKYQLIIESMELAGEGALLKMLEERRKRLEAEGLFAAERKKPLPYLPKVIGVVTSPTGAVIRDILHRLRDRFPRHVLVWPVLVQGEGAAEQIARAIQGFDALEGESGIKAENAKMPTSTTTHNTPPKPDLIIVARGGGSLENLMAFNEEIVVRAIANCSIPLISAVGHETDTTLADYAADQRAPTPTAAAEMAVPVRAELYALLKDDEKRLVNGLHRTVRERQQRLETLSAKLGDPARLLDSQAQNLDLLAERLKGNFKNTLAKREAALSRLAGNLRHPKMLLDNAAQKLGSQHERLKNTLPRLLEAKTKELGSTARILDSLSYTNVLKRGYVVVRSEANIAISAPETITSGQSLELEFADNKRVKVAAKPAE
ncbi:MAG: exodeoxyribonuclease VII large subunit [Alphaproteobacteria bacterium]